MGKAWSNRCCGGSRVRSALTGHKLVESTLFQCNLSAYCDVESTLDLKKVIKVNCCFEGEISTTGLCQHCNIFLT